MTATVGRNSKNTDEWLNFLHHAAASVGAGFKAGSRNLQTTTAPPGRRGSPHSLDQASSEFKREDVEGLSGLMLGRVADAGPGR